MHHTTFWSFCFLIWIYELRDSCSVSCSSLLYRIIHMCPYSEIRRAVHIKWKRRNSKSESVKLKSELLHPFISFWNSTFSQPRCPSSIRKKILVKKTKWIFSFFLYKMSVLREHIILLNQQYDKKYLLFKLQ